MAACVLRLSSKLVQFLVILIATTQLKRPAENSLSLKVLSKVCDFHVGQELCKPAITFHRIKKSKSTPLVPLAPELKFRRILWLAQEFILVNALLQCNDISLNPGPVRKTCAGCFKVFKKNQGLLSCIECQVNLISISNALVQTLKRTGHVDYVHYLRPIVYLKILVI